MTDKLKGNIESAEYKQLHKQAWNTEKVITSVAFTRREPGGERWKQYKGAVKTPVEMEHYIPEEEVRRAYLLRNCVGNRRNQTWRS